MDFVFIYGPPGVGKLTVAKELTSRTGYKLFDNHASIDVALPLFSFGTDAFWQLVEYVRLGVFQAAAAGNVSLVSTFVYGPPTRENVDWKQRGTTALFPQIEEIARRHVSRICMVRLTCQMEELSKRIEAPGRLERGKLASFSALESLLTMNDVFATFPGRDSLVIDNTALSPTQVVDLIANHFRLPSKASSYNFSSSELL